MRSYWELLYKKNRDPEDQGALRSACMPDFSLFGNRILGYMHQRAFLALLKKNRPLPGSWLDLGCGGGRWLKILNDRGIKPYGLDIAFEALFGIRSRETFNLFQGSAALLPFRNESFPALSHVTVLQHLPYDLQEKAGNEIRRILVKGGCWLLLEHLAPGDRKKEELGWEGMYPRSAAEWFAFVRSRAFRPLFLLRFQYIPCTRKALAFFRSLEAARKRFSGPGNPLQAQSSTGSGLESGDRAPSGLRLRAYRALRSVTYDLTLTVDLFMDFFFGLRQGSHIAILSQKE